MCLDFEALTPEDRHTNRDQRRRVIAVVPKNTAAAIFLTAEAIRLLEVQFRLEDALLAIAVAEADDPQEDGGGGDGKSADLGQMAAGHGAHPDCQMVAGHVTNPGRRAAATHLREAIPLCQEIGERLVLAAQTSFKFVTEALASSQAEDLIMKEAWGSSPYLSPNKASSSVKEDLKEEELGQYLNEEEEAPGQKEKLAPGLHANVIKTKEEEESDGEHSAHSPMDEKSFSCAECSESFSTKRDLNKHKRIHGGKTSKKRALHSGKGKKSFSCSVCKKCFPKPSLLIAHERMHTGEKPFPCTTCGKAFSAASHLKVHLRIHTGEKPYPCLQCDMRFAMTRSLKRHELTHAAAHQPEMPPDQFHCEDCGKSFISSKKYNKHVTRHTLFPSAEKLFNCSDCNKSFRVKAVMLNHMKIHSGEKPFNCSTCGKLFRSLTNLKRHEMTHTGEKPFGCDQCHKAFNQSTSLIVHMRIHTGEKPFVCSTCGRAFRSSTAMRQHEQQAHSELGLKAQGVNGTGIRRQRSKEKIHKCSECSKAFARKQNLKIHIRTHTGDMPFICQTCAKAFVSAGQLKIHETIHTGEKPHACTACSKSFRTDQQLKVHMRVHTGEKPYICSECSKAFAKWTHLQSHLRIHTGEKPYSCSLCNKAFAVKGNLKGHMKVHTGDSYHKKRPVVLTSLSSP